VRKGDDVTTPNPIRSPGTQDAGGPISPAEKLEEDASLAVAAGALDGEVACQVCFAGIARS
jgi:hypothetical protein